MKNGSSKGRISLVTLRTVLCNSGGESPAAVDSRDKRRGHGVGRRTVDSILFEEFRGKGRKRSGWELERGVRRRRVFRWERRGVFTC